MMRDSNNRPVHEEIGSAIDENMERLKEAEHPFKDPHSSFLQQAEGGGPMRRTHLADMPLPVRVFGYVLIAISIVMVIFVAVITFRD
ncbi:hypothetical protein [Paenibacillus soyae]|uniref:Uncharacterized protein n=1 Tax=Paenibacillus soyae TaxID=2969249 RepID=A0A9X2MSB8_9BACL|nr:hypothetical protein [Paenibacillus soyae]MCR2807298.1 hypothetical protein [Paenibacillus soyae]